MSALNVRELSVPQAAPLRLVPHLSPVQEEDTVHFNCGPHKGLNATVLYTSIPGATRPALVVYIWAKQRAYVTVREHLALHRAPGTSPDYLRKAVAR